MLYYKLGQIMPHKEAGARICPISMPGDVFEHCKGTKCPKWVRMADVAYFLTDEERKELVKVHPDEWWISHGFCSL